MTLKIPEISSVTPRFLEEIEGLSVYDEKCVDLNNASLNVENSTVHIGNVIHHHLHIPPGLGDTEISDSSASKDDEFCPQKPDAPRDEPSNKYDILLNNKKICIIITLVFVAALLTGMFLLLNFSHPHKESETGTPKDDNEDSDSESKPSESFDNLTNLKGCKIFEEEDWGLKRNLGDIVLKHPVPLVIISHAATPFCNTTSSCKTRIKNIQEYHISTGSPDIGYNFIVGGDGNIYVGRGWNARNFHRGNHSIGINLIGNFFRDQFTPKMIRCVKAIMDFGMEAKILTDDYKVVGHNQTNTNTLSPGPIVYAEVKKWPHFMDGLVSWSFLYEV